MISDLGIASNRGVCTIFPASNRKRSRTVTKFPARLSRWSDIRTSYFGLMCWPLPSSKQNCAVVLPARKFKDIRALRSRFVLCDLHFRTLNRPPLCGVCEADAIFAFTMLALSSQNTSIHGFLSRLLLEAAPTDHTAESVAVSSMRLQPYPVT